MTVNFEIGDGFDFYWNFLFMFVCYILDEKDACLLKLAQSTIY